MNLHVLPLPPAFGLQPTTEQQPRVYVYDLTQDRSSPISTIAFPWKYMAWALALLASAFAQRRHHEHHDTAAPTHGQFEAKKFAGAAQSRPCSGWR